MPARIAIMQPYLFPYLGYFQLAQAVDVFWLLDTVSFIQQGWMNRNALRAGNGRSLFTLPIAHAPHDTPIRQRAYHPKARTALAKLRRRMAYEYARAPHQARALSLIDDVARAFDSNGPDFTEVTEFALARTFETVGINTPIRRMSQLALDPSLTGEARIIAACQSIGAAEYINMIGGSALYSADVFAQAGITLSFMSPVLCAYDQGGMPFLPALSVLDAVAHVDPEDLTRMLQAGDVTKAIDTAAK